MNGLFPQGEADFSSCGMYRYRLTRENIRLGVAPATCTFVMLNPSTADADFDDPTIRKCKKLAALWGHGRLVIVNLYAFRSTDPKKMWWAHGAKTDIVGPDNDSAIVRAVQEARTTGGKVVAAWGRGSAKAPSRSTISGEARFHQLRTAHVCKLIGDALECLGTNNDGSPVHPLYQPDDSEPMRWRGM